jgi:hypothetical protein
MDCGDRYQRVQYHADRDTGGRPTSMAGQKVHGGGSCIGSGALHEYVGYWCTRRTDTRVEVDRKREVLLFGPSLAGFVSNGIQTRDSLDVHPKSADI